MRIIVLAKGGLKVIQLNRAIEFTITKTLSDVVYTIIIFIIIDFLLSPYSNCRKVPQVLQEYGIYDLKRAAYDLKVMQ